MNKVLTRAIFGAIYVGVILAGVLCGRTALFIVLSLLTILGIGEFLHLTSTESDDRSSATALDIFGGWLMVYGLIYTPLYTAVGFYLIYLIVRLSLQLWLRSGNAVRALACSLASQLYVALPVALMVVIYNVSPHLLLSLFVMVWVNDTFAFIVGCSIGKHRLWERISPKKSWEGFWGGLIFTVGFAALAGWLWPEYLGGLTAVPMALLGLVVAVAATLGDLIESLIKRSVGVKDSGHLIPGHGGILDRIDSLLLVIPTVTAILLLFRTFAQNGLF